MSSRSLQGGDLNLSDLTVTESTTVKDINVTGEATVNQIVTNDISTGNLATHTLTSDSMTLAGAINVNGATWCNQGLTVADDIYCNGAINFNPNAQTNLIEVLWYQLTGNAGSVNEVMTLANNTSGTTNYSVFPSFYYGFSGSGGTYDLNGTAGALQQQIIINNRTSTTFNWYLNKSSGDNINVIVTFLVVYNVGTSGYPSSY